MVNLPIACTLRVSGRKPSRWVASCIICITGKPTGKQTIQELIGQNQGVTNIDISKTDLKGFEKYARKYGVDYAITKDKSVLPPKYLVFFKARDADAMTAAFNAYSAEILAKNKRPSVLKTLHKLIDAVRDIPAKVVSRDKQREQSR